MQDKELELVLLDLEEVFPRLVYLSEFVKDGDSKSRCLEMTLSFFLEVLKSKYDINRIEFIEEEEDDGDGWKQGYYET